MNSHLLLSQDGECDANEDGLLRASELLKLDIQADLTVFSASETVRGRARGGEAIVAMAWALWLAGCPTTMITQWKGDFTGTVRFMVEFYRRMNIEELNARGTPFKTRAIRSAQLKLLKSKIYRHPYYWAQFTLVGAG